MTFSSIKQRVKELLTPIETQKNLFLVAVGSALFGIALTIGLTLVGGILTGFAMIFLKNVLATFIVVGLLTILISIACETFVHGIYRAGLKVVRQEPIEMGDIFYGFKNFKKLAPTYACYQGGLMLLNFVILFIFILLGSMGTMASIGQTIVNSGTNPDAAMMAMGQGLIQLVLVFGIAILINIVLTMVYASSFVLTPYIADYEGVSKVNAMKLSAQKMNGHKMTYIKTVFFYGIIGVLILIPVNLVTFWLPSFLQTLLQYAVTIYFVGMRSTVAMAIIYNEVQ